MNLVVTDTGPLLHLHQIGAGNLLARLGEIHLTPHVWTELQRHLPSFRQTGLPSWIKLCQPSPASAQTAAQWVQARLLDAGEAEALAYACEIQAGIFLTDDTAARTLAESFGLQVRGSLGVVLFAAASGHLGQAACSQVLDGLEVNSTLWMSTKVKSAARTALAQMFAGP